MVQDHFWENAFLTRFGPVFGPAAAHLQSILGFSMGKNTSPWAEKWAKNTCLSTPNGPGSLLGKHVFDSF